MLNRISRALEVPLRAWCRVMHPDPMWPVAGFYRCPSCLRQYPVQWELPELSAYAPARLHNLRPELSPLLRAAVPLPTEGPPIKVFSAG